MNPGQFLEQYTYEWILEQILDNVPNDIDKKTGSIVYDAVAPAAYQLADFYLQLYNIVGDIYLQTAVGEYLDLKAEEWGVSRIQATHTIKYGMFTNTNGVSINVPLGTRFSTVIDGSVSTIWSVTKTTSTVGTMELTCEDAGTVGNAYTGLLVPITNINNLGTAILGETLVIARDTETDEEFRSRILEFVNEKPYGGNFADYKEFVGNMDGVGGVQIYPVWNGGGTVKVVVVDGNYDPASNALLNRIKQAVDPTTLTGEGAGIAPIGHQVTVVSPTSTTISVSLDVELVGFTLDQLRDDIIDQVNEYFLYLRKTWGNNKDNHKYYNRVYRAEIITRIVNNIPGVANVKNVRLNGNDDDIELNANNNSSQLPYAGGVSINEVFS